jgi:hypothetical protein
MSQTNQLRVGLFDIGLDTYWPQFKGLKPRLECYVRTVQKKLERPAATFSVADALSQWRRGLVGSGVSARTSRNRQWGEYLIAIARKPFGGLGNLWPHPLQFHPDANAVVF